MGTIRVDGREIDLTMSVGPSNGSPLQELTTFGSVTAQFDLVSGNTLSVVVAGNSAEAPYINELASDIWMTGFINERFRLWAVWQDFDKDGDNRVSMQGVTYDRLLNRRLVMDEAGLAFDDVDQGLIVWGLWEHTQSQLGGDLGVTLGPDYLTGITRDRNYKPGENLGQLAEALTKVENGLWWGINSDLEYVAKMPADFPTLATPIVLGVNARHLQRASGGADFANAVYGDAKAELTTPVIVEAVDVATDPRGRWEVAKAWPTVEQQTTLQQNAEGALLTANSPLTHWNITMEPSRWVYDSRLMPGDFAVLAVPPLLAAPIGTPATRIVIRVTGVVVNFDNNGSLEVKLVASETAIPPPAE
jgi:hypothetical protein